MVTLLLIVIYIAFIGLGVPDSLFGTGTVTLVSTLLTAIAIIGMSHTGSFLFMCLCALPLGLGAGAIDTGLNNYVSLHYSASQMSFLHCFYGIGITVSPFLISKAMNDGGGWRSGYTMAFWIQIAIALILLISLPLWKRDSDEGSDENTRVMSMKEIASTPGVKLMWAMFFASVTIEMSCGGWACTYLVESKGLSAETGAGLILYYFLGIAVGRFLSGLLATKLSCRAIIRFGMVVLGCGIVMLTFAPSAGLAVTALFLIALGNSPMFPNFTYLTPSRFGKEKSASIMGTQFAVSNIAYMAMPVVCSLLGQTLGMWVFPWFLLLAFAVLLAATVWFKLQK